MYRRGVQKSPISDLSEYSLHWDGLVVRAQGAEIIKVDASVCRGTQADQKVL